MKEKTIPLWATAFLVVTAVVPTATTRPPRPRAAAMAALEIPREICRSYAMRFSWQTSIEQFLSHVVPVHHPSGNHFYAERARYAGLV